MYKIMYTALRYIDKNNFECPELGVVQKCPMILGEYQSPGGKFFWKQNFEKNAFWGKKKAFLSISLALNCNSSLRNPKKSYQCVIIVKVYRLLP